jgi:beta-lactamase class A
VTRENLMQNAIRLRAAVIVALSLGALAGCSADPPAGEAAPSPPVVDVPSVDPDFEKLEDEFDARLGVHAHDTGTGVTVEYRDEERFAYASTIKVLAATVLLDKTTDAELDTLIVFDESDLLEYAPIAKQHVDTGMTLRALAEAAVRYSDNTAANLVLDRIGGPIGLGAALTDLGDDITQVARDEPELNEATPGDPRDTSTPRALAADLEYLVLEDALEPADRQTLTEWLLGNATGDELIRAGVPADWRVGDKSGAGGYGTRNDIAVVWPSAGDPIVLVIMSSSSEPDAGYDNALIARATEIAIDALGR